MAMPRWLVALLPASAAAVSLFAGLMPTLLDYGRFEPLDWLLPGFVALAVLRWRDGPGIRRALWHWALLAAPPILVVALSASVLPQVKLVLLVLLLALGALILARAGRNWWLFSLVGLGLFGGIRYELYILEGGPVKAASAEVRVMSALPLFARDQGEGGLLHGVGVRAPLVEGLGKSWSAEPIDLLDGASLKGVDHLLLIQPRLLAPGELVALDDWVRRGGTVAILADPLLRWPDDRPLGDPRRPPLTSLLDPLMTHWGLTLEPARVGPVERRVLAGGSMIQLAGASRFTVAGDAPCSLAEADLIAYCRIGKGRAVLVADADWIDDRLWTLAPERPQDRRAWTSDAIPLLSRLITWNEGQARPGGAWLVSQQALTSALRWGLGLILLLGSGPARLAPIPMLSHVRIGDRPRPEKESGKPPPDSA
ncbi:MAG TPA: hypothetical protein VGE65_04735 [Sphingobium sp.]